MAVPIEQIVRGAVFRFKTANRLVVECKALSSRGFVVHWQYADGKKRGGKLGGAQWVHYFRAEALEQVPPEDGSGETVILIGGKRIVPRRKELVEVTLLTKAPQKYAIVDMETGELWGHDGDKFRRLTEDECREVSAVAEHGADSAKAAAAASA